MNLLRLNRILLAVISALTTAVACGQSVAVEGPGYLRLSDEGRSVFAKSVKLAIVNGKLASAAGQTFLPIVLCDDLRAVSVRADGTVVMKGIGIGRLMVVQFENGATLTKKGTIYVASDRPQLGYANEGGSGSLKFEFAGATSAPVPNRGGAKRGDVPEIRIKPESVVDHSPFTLGDIADISADPAQAEMLRAVPIGDTPALGAVRGLDFARIAARLRMAKITPEKLRIIVPTGAKVMQVCQWIEADQFVKAAVDAAVEKYGEYGTLIGPESGSRFAAPLGELTFTATGITAQANRIRMTIDVYLLGRKVTSRPMVLERSGVPDPVRVGETVTVIVRSGKIQVTVKGKVIRVGKPGENVEVSTGDGSTLSGKLVSAHTIEVTP